MPALLDVAAVQPGAGVLDVGAGTGAVAAAARARGASVVAVDAEPDMTACVADRLPGVATVCAALPELPFADEAFDAVVGNFVVNHVGRPRHAVAELRRVTRSGGRVAVTVWAAPAAAGQALLGRAVAAAGVAGGAVLGLDPADDFPRTPAGFAAVLRGAGLAGVRCQAVEWAHRTTVERWWRGPAEGLAGVGRLLAGLTAAEVVRVEAAYRRLCGGFTAPDGTLVLPHRALLAHGRA
ncbi:class I SAM-dependent methyltransferase [Labedaea rhizosphaerae]|uniref:Methyltransferase family protein n=1 Tax=Labedaea rhizosphaerae TaxID=598644 RepID=A0A4R6SB38_LABRH|nr:methyltransferase family protein [Labedaea rhizosphaerae]